MGGGSHNPNRRSHCLVLALLEGSEESSIRLSYLLLHRSRQRPPHPPSWHIILLNHHQHRRNESLRVNKT